MQCLVKCIRLFNQEVVKNNIYGMDKKKTTSILYKEFGFNLSRTAPDALRGKFATEHALWDLMDDCNTILLVLITDRILTDVAIIKIIERFNEFAEEISHYLNAEEQIRLGIYWISVLDWMKKRCLEEDQFECCSNIKKFGDYYFSITPEDLDD